MSPSTAGGSPGSRARSSSGGSAKYSSTMSSRSAEVCATPQRRSTQGSGREKYIAAPSCPGSTVPSTRRSQVSLRHSAPRSKCACSSDPVAAHDLNAVVRPSGLGPVPHCRPGDPPGRVQVAGDGRRGRQIARGGGRQGAGPGRGGGWARSWRRGNRPPQAAVKRARVASRATAARARGAASSRRLGCLDAAQTSRATREVRLCRPAQKLP